jgi:hypothetical protein
MLDEVFLFQFLNLEGYKCIVSGRTHLNEQQCAYIYKLQTAMCDEENMLSNPNGRWYNVINCWK